MNLVLLGKNSLIFSSDCRSNYEHSTNKIVNSDNSVATNEDSRKRGLYLQSYVAQQVLGDYHKKHLCF